MSSKRDRDAAGGHDSLLPPAARCVLETLETNGYEAYLVGGCVRDMVLCRAANDYDVATNARPDEVMRLFSHVVPTGLAHGTVTVIEETHKFEVTTYRVDATYSDGRHPDRITYARSLTEDLLRRDFTMNAMAMDKDLHLVDPMKGRADAKEGIIRAVGDADRRFSEDALRILRAIRFAAKLGFTIEENTHRAMQRNAGRLKNVSMERVGQELLGIAKSNWFTVAGILGNEPYLSSTKTSLHELQSAFRHLSETLHGSKRLDFTRWESFLTRCKEDTGSTKVILPGAKQAGGVHRELAAVALWASCLSEGVEAASVFRSLGWPKVFMKTAQRAREYLAREPWNWPTYEWRKALVYGNREALDTAALLADWLDADRKRTSCLELLASVRATTPVERVSDLALSGRDLTDLGLRGPVVGRTIEEMVDAVLKGQVGNSREELLQFVTRVIGRTQ